MNVLFNKPHVIAFGEINLQPGEPGNRLTAEQFARLQAFPLFHDCVRMGQIVVRDDEGKRAEAPKAIVAQVVDTGEADKEIERELAAKAEVERLAAAAKTGDKPKTEGDGKPVAGTQGAKAEG